MTGWLPAPDGEWRQILFLLDAGADRTVVEARFAATFVPAAQLSAESEQLGGVGGVAQAFAFHSVLAFEGEDGQPAVVRGDFAVFADPASSDISVLGRDVTENFDVIYSYPRREFPLLSGRHRYEVVRSD